MRGSFNLYQIPPDWDTLALHSQASKVYQSGGEWGHECPCCGRRIGSSRVPLCEHTYSFISISEELSLFFSYNKTVIILLSFYGFALLTAKALSATTPVSFRYDLPGV